MKRYLLLAFYLGIFVFLSYTNAQQSKQVVSCNLALSEKISVVYNAPPKNFLNGVKSSEFDITFKNSTPELETAVNYAASIWCSILVSNVPVRVLITFYPMPDFLGQCVSNMVKDFPGAPSKNTWYVSALSDAITGVDQQPGDYDMDIFLTSSVPWYTGTDGIGGSKKFDLVSVALHEMGHGLGYFGLGYDSAGTGSYGHITPNVLTRPIAFPFPDLEGLPSLYDKHIINSEDKHITDTADYSNPSLELGDLFVSNDLFFEGENADLANGKKPVKLYADSIFIFASSLLHLDENSYLPGNINTLMTPFVALGEANHTPGPVTIGLLKDLGWSINDSISTDVEDEAKQLPDKITLNQNYPNPFNPETTISFFIPSSSMVQLNVFNILGQQVASLIDREVNSGNHRIVFNSNGLSSGIYLYKLSVNGKYIALHKMILMK